MKRSSVMFSAIVLIFIFAASCSSSDSKGPQAVPNALLPTVDEMAGFAHVMSAADFARDKAWDHLGSSADKWLYNGFQSGMTAQYASADHDRKLTLEEFEFSDPGRAFAIYCYIRPPQYQTVDLNPAGYVGHDTLVFVKGVHVGRVIASYGKAENEMIAAAKLMLSKLSDSVLLPVQLKYFPTEGLIANSETVTLDDIEGVNKKSNRYSAAYRLGADSVRMYLRFNPADGPTLAVQEFVGSKGQIKDYIMDSGYQALTGLDESGRLVYCALDKGVLCTIVGNVDLKAAQGLANQMFTQAAAINR
jgi:hypothetical protein